MGESDTELLEVIGSIYATAEDPAGWPEVLRRLALLLRATAGTLSIYKLKSRHGEVAAGFEIDPEFGRSYRENFASKDVWINSPHARKAVRHVVTSQMLVRDDQLICSEFYQDFLRPQNIFHLIGSRVQERSNSTAMLSLFRSKNEVAFGQDEIDRLETLRPHILRAMQVFFRLHAVCGIEKAVDGILDRLPFGVILVTSAGKPLHVNQAGNEIAAARDGLVLRSERVEASSPSETTVLLRFISEASCICSRLDVRPGGALRLSRPSCKPALIVLVAPVARNTGFFSEELPSAVLFVTDPTSNLAQAPEQALSSLFGLTRAESRICRLLVGGSSLEQAASKLGISMNTARTHVKRVFDKTGAHRQSDLMLLFTSRIPPIRES